MLRPCIECATPTGATRCEACAASWGRRRGSIGWQVRTKQAVKARDGERCQNCGSTEELEMDHIKPLVFGGANIIGNLRLLCHGCHVAIGGGRGG